MDDDDLAGAEGTATEHYEGLFSIPIAPEHRARTISLEVLEPAASRGATWSGADRCAIGSHESCDLGIADPTVSRLHCEIVVGEDGALVRDLGSRNGTQVDGLVVREAFARDGSLLRLGAGVVRVTLSRERIVVPVSTRTQLGDLVGVSVAARRTFGALERCAASSVTVLLEGETGTGKDVAAEALHRESARAAGPFVVVDCGAIPGNLLESELLGHEQGAFTGASRARIGAFEAAHGGTVFLDEIGELPLELQPKLLRVLEERAIRRVGSTRRIPVDIRIVAATNRRLGAEVNAGRFRADLYYRLAVARIDVPALRERLEDIPVIAEALLERMGADEATRRALLTPRFLGWLASRAWPGNVRELRNVLEQRLVFDVRTDAETEIEPPAASPARASVAVDVDVPYPEARRRWLEEFERAYTTELVARHDGNVSAAARAAGIDRVYLHRLLRRSRER
ncbi:MAG: sigma 54-dependent Fis family transcriptional regulator [Myxococcota bacterium]|nr:sigma 54-dependent Fis family transcriptional regulator [Myxococcota bacterium]